MQAIMAQRAAHAAAGQTPAGRTDPSVGAELRGGRRAAQPGEGNSRVGRGGSGRWRARRVPLSWCPDHAAFPPARLLAMTPGRGWERASGALRGARMRPVWSPRASQPLRAPLHLPDRPETTAARGPCAEGGVQPQPGTPAGQWGLRGVTPIPGRAHPALEHAVREAGGTGVPPGHAQAFFPDLQGMVGGGLWARVTHRRRVPLESLRRSGHPPQALRRLCPGEWGDRRSGCWHGCCPPMSLIPRPRGCPEIMGGLEPIGSTPSCLNVPGGRSLGGSRNCSKGWQISAPPRGLLRRGFLGGILHSTQLPVFAAGGKQTKGTGREGSSERLCRPRPALGGTGPQSQQPGPLALHSELGPASLLRGPEEQCQAWPPASPCPTSKALRG